MKGLPLLLLALAALLLGGGGGAVYVTAVLSERDRVRRALRDASLSYGLDPDWLDAIGKVESGWRMDTRNLAGPDGARGGSYGPTQISQRTARAHGYTGDMEAFCEDPGLAAAWSALILSAGHPGSLAEAVAVWNAGRYGADRDGDGELDPGEAPTSTVNTYWPRALDALAYVQAHPAPEDAA